MAHSSSALICGYLSEAITFGKAFEGKLRKFASQGDDEDVQAAFSMRIEQAKRQEERLVERLKQLDSGVASDEGASAYMLEAVTHPLPFGEIQEEGVVYRLITAFGVEQASRAFFEALTIVAAASADTITEALARQIQAEEEQAGKKFLSFIRSRSKIAYNMLTPNELDPAIETKAFSNPVV